MTGVLQFPFASWSWLRGDKDRFERFAQYSAVESEEGLLPPEKTEGLPRHRRSSCGYHTVIFLLVLNLTILALLFLRPYLVATRPEQLAYSLASDIITFERKTVDTQRHTVNPYNGYPTEASDYAWHNLLRNTNIKVTEDVLQKANRSLVAVSDGSGYFVIPDVFHQLHCLKSIRQWIYRDYYQLEEHEKTLPHLDHCIDNLRQNVMCRGDMGLLTFDWADWTPEPIPYFVQEHTCVNFDALNAWAGQYTIDIFDESTIVHPTLGPSYRGLADVHDGPQSGKVVGFEGVVVNHFSDDVMQRRDADVAY